MAPQTQRPDQQQRSRGAAPENRMERAPQNRGSVPTPPKPKKRPTTPKPKGK